MVGCIAGAVDARSTAEGIDFKAAVVGETGQTAGVPESPCLQERILAKGRTCLLDIEAMKADVCGAEHLETRPEYLAGLTEFPRIAGSEYETRDHFFARAWRRASS